MQQEQTPDIKDTDREAIDAVDSELEAVTDEQTDAAAEELKAEAELNTAQRELADALTDARAKSDEYLALAQRVQADFENYKRRNKNVRAEAYDDGARAFATTLLPVLDNLERATAAAANSPDTALKDGVEMVQRQLVDAFAKRGVTAIDRKGEKFDPNLENAVMQGSADDGEPGTVCEVFQKGYQMSGQVLRHAMVKVVPE